MPKYLLVLICIFFLFTRLYKIAEIPPSIYWDEASIGYNAYSIAQTGKDEWGEVFPVHFRAFGEFKLPVYIYATAISVKLFGLNEFSVRFPAALFSLGVVILTYFLAKRLFGSTNVGLLSSFFVSISPWFFIFSRTGYEATAGLAFYLFAVLLLLPRLKGKHLFFSVLCFILAAYSYNSFRIISPLSFLIMIIYKRDEIREIKKDFIYLVLLGILLFLSIIPIYRLYRYDAGGTRLQAVSATNANFVRNYLSHFSPDFLILRGDKRLRSQQAGFGQLYLPELILLPLGFLYIYMSKLKYKLLPFVLLAFGPIPAAITIESPHALRAISTFPFLAIISAFGIDRFQQRFKNNVILTPVAITVFFVFFANYYLNFLYVYPVQSAGDWQYEYKRVYDDIDNKLDQYNKILISDEYAQPYIFTLFYLKYDPNKFRQEVIRNNVSEWGFSTVKSFGKFEFVKSPKLLNTE